MGSPLNGAIYAHKAFRKELNDLEEEAERLDTARDAWVADFAGRVAFFHRIVKAHNTGEEEVAWPAIDGRFPNVTLPYTFDHRADEETFLQIEGLLGEIQKAGDSRNRAELIRQVKRLFTVINAHVSSHANREDAHIIPLLQENFSLAEQGEMSGRMVAHLPRDEMPRIMPMLVSALTIEERVDYVGAMQHAMPPEAFKAATGWIKAGIPEVEWSELAGRVPGLVAS